VAQRASRSQVPSSRCTRTSWQHMRSSSRYEHWLSSSALRIAEQSDEADQSISLNSCRCYAMCARQSCPALPRQLCCPAACIYVCTYCLSCCYAGGVRRYGC
jgi:hypothetical protein